MFDPLSMLMMGAGALIWKEMQRKDYGVMTLQRDERYRERMANCLDPQMLMQEAKLFDDHGLKTQAAMLRRRAQWRARPEPVKQQHDEVYARAMQSQNIPAILEIANLFEGWTASRKAANLRAYAQSVQEAQMTQAAEDAVAAPPPPPPAPPVPPTGARPPAPVRPRPQRVPVGPKAPPAPAPEKANGAAHTNGAPPGRSEVPAATPHDEYEPAP